MITNAREYQITRAQVARLETSLKSALQQGAPKDIHPTIRKAELAALESEIRRLHDELAAYDELVEGRKLYLDKVRLEDLPDVLIKARIANRLSQKQLADRIGIHEQQVQRYESNRYRGVSFDRLIEVAKVLGVQAEQNVVLAAPALKNARSALKNVGFSDAFIDYRLVLSATDDENLSTAVPALERVNRIFGWSSAELSLPHPPRIAESALGGARFKVPAGRNAAYLEAYTAYAYRLACGAARCAEHLPRTRVPSDWQSARTAILKAPSITLAQVVDWMWDLGVVVLPLSDKAAFNGAFWRIDGRNVIIIKQRTDSPDRLVHDLLHESYHCSKDPDVRTRVVIDLDTSGSDAEEIEANTFASDVLLNGRANDLALKVAAAAGGYGPALKSAVAKVAKESGVSVGALANHLAWILERQDNPISWWGTAHNLQDSAQIDLRYARDKAFQSLVPPPEADLDVDLLFRALRAVEPS